MTARRFFALALLLALPAPVRAEVSASIASDGQIDRVDVLTNPREGIVWKKILDTPEPQVLNQGGDRYRDLPPACGILSLPLDDPTKLTSQPSLRSAVVVWPRSDGEDYELVFSVWNPTLMTWNPTQHVVKTDDNQDDLMPWVYVLDQRVYLLWRRGPAGEWMVAVGKIDVGSPLPTIVWAPPVTLNRGILIDGIDFYTLASDGGSPDQPKDGGRGR